MAVAVFEEETTSEEIEISVCKASVKKEESVKTWNLDSGASHHMTPSREILQDFDDTVKGKVKWGDGKRSPVEGRGRVTMRMKDKYGGYELTLKEVYYAPELDQNLISVRQFDEKGFKITTFRGVKKISEDGEVFLKGYWNEKVKMYETRAEVYLKSCQASGKKKEEEKIVELEISGKRATIDLWHARFGHQLGLPDACEAKGKL